jgi:protein phosphatase
MIIVAAVVVLLVLAGLAVGRHIIRGNYYITEHAGTVSIMQGIQGSILGIAMSQPFLLGCLNDRNELSQISYGQKPLDCRLMQLQDLRPSERAQVAAGLPGGTLDDAIEQLKQLASTSLLPLCAAPPPPAPPAPKPPAPSPANRPGATPEPSPQDGGASETRTPTPGPASPTAPAPGPAPAPPAGPLPPGSPAPSPPPTVTTLPPAPQKPGTDCRAAA